MSIWHVYILYSPRRDSYYVGMSQRLQRRIAQHRRGTTRTTALTDDWVVVYTEKTFDSTTARAMEKAIKARGAKRFIADCAFTETSQAPSPAKRGVN
jgi:putative endonuclease